MPVKASDSNQASTTAPALEAAAPAHEAAALALESAVPTTAMRGLIGTVHAHIELYLDRVADKSGCICF